MGPYLLIFFYFPWRSQFPREGDFVRYGPSFSNGPGGIRTLDLFSAIEARSQLRYRPDDRSKLQGKKILPEWGVNVKLEPGLKKLPGTS